VRRAHVTGTRTPPDMASWPRRVVVSLERDQLAARLDSAEPGCRRSLGGTAVTRISAVRVVPEGVAPLVCNCDGLAQHKATTGPELVMVSGRPRLASAAELGGYGRPSRSGGNRPRLTEPVKRARADSSAKILVRGPPGPGQQWSAHEPNDISVRRLGLHGPGGRPPGNHEIGF